MKHNACSVFTNVAHKKKGNKIHHVPFERPLPSVSDSHLQWNVGDPFSSKSTTVLVYQTFGESASKLSSSQTVAFCAATPSSFFPLVVEPPTPYVKEWKPYTELFLGGMAFWVPSLRCKVVIVPEGVSISSPTNIEHIRYHLWNVHTSLLCRTSAEEAMFVIN